MDKQKSIQLEFISKQSQTNKHIKDGQKVWNIVWLQLCNYVKIKDGPKTKTHICYLIKISLQSCIVKFGPVSDSEVEWEKE